MGRQQLSGRGRPLAQVEVEELILECIDALEDGHDAYEAAMVRAANLRADYEEAHARARIAYIDTCDHKPTEWEAKMVAAGRPEVLSASRVSAMAEATATIIKDGQFVLRAKLEGLRTLAANQRTLVS